MRDRGTLVGTRNAPSSASEGQGSTKGTGRRSEGNVAVGSVLAGESSSDGDEEWWAMVEEEDVSGDTTTTSTIPERCVVFY